MYPLRAIYNNNPKLSADDCVIKPQTCGYSSFYHFHDIRILTQQFFHHTNAYRTPLLKINIINVCLKGHIQLQS